MKHIKYGVLFVLLGGVICENAYAYLDPASGNALVSFLIALVGSALFFIKSVFYRFFSSSSSSSTERKLKSGQDIEQSMPLIFSEGKTYWTTFRPIVEEFINQKTHFRYVTLDVHDPGLTIDSEYMHAKRFSKNRLGFAKLAKLRSPVMLSTTPNIGSDEYPMKRPAGVQNLVHVFHAMVDLSCYRKGSLDFYDSVLMTGAHEKSSIRMVEKARNLKEKELIVAGLPCLDDLYRQKKELVFENRSDDKSFKTVLVAPSWGAKGCFSEYGTNFVKKLSKAGYHVIIRLHPHSYTFEPDAVERWQTQTENCQNVVWDDHTFGTQAMARADILISDASSIRFDFVFLYKKPVISLTISRQSRSIFEGDYIPETWADSMSDKIGSVVNKDNIHMIDQVVQETITGFSPTRLVDLRGRCVANFGNSAPAITAYLNRQAEILSLTPEQRSLKQQLDELKNEIIDLREQLNHVQSVTSGNKFK